MSQACAENTAVVPDADECDLSRRALERIRDALRGLRFGTVTAIIHDGVVVQIERTEKLRLVRL